MPGPAAAEKEFILVATCTDSSDGERAGAGQSAQQGFLSVFEIGIASQSKHASPRSVTHSITLLKYISLTLHCSDHNCSCMPDLHGCEPHHNASSVLLSTLLHVLLICTALQSFSPVKTHAGAY